MSRSTTTLPRGTALPRNPLSSPLRELLSPSHHPPCAAETCRRGSATLCRLCHRPFCSRHCRTPLRVGGAWGAVCAGCYAARPGAGYAGLAERDLTDDYTALRNAAVASSSLRHNQLVGRLSRVAAIVNSTPAGLWFDRVARGSRIRAQVQEVVPWGPADSCGICARGFGLLRAHHCRLCGRAVCEDDSMEVPIGAVCERLLDEDGTSVVPPVADTAYPLRLCATCRDDLVGVANWRRVLAAPPPRFWAMVGQLQQVDETVGQILTAPLTLRTRERVIAALSHYDVLLKQVAAVATATPGDDRVRAAAVKRYTACLRAHTLEVKKEALRAQQQMAPQHPPPPPRRSLRETRELRETLMVQREQLFLLQQMVADATAGRRFDEVPPLQESAGEVAREVARLELELDADGF